MARISGVTLSGFISDVFSAVSVNLMVVWMAVSSVVSAFGVRRDGVPPPRNRLCAVRFL